MAVTIAQICDAITAVVGSVSAVTRTQSYNELTEGINNADTPLAQVYWQDLGMSVPGSTDRATFKAGRRNKQMTFRVDLHASQRGHLGQNVGDAVDTFDLILTALEAQKEKPYFALAGIQAWSLTAERVTFVYAEASYIGFRANITIWVF
jgi:hypothetical protein